MQSIFDLHGERISRRRFLTASAVASATAAGAACGLTGNGLAAGEDPAASAPTTTSAPTTAPRAKGPPVDWLREVQTPPEQLPADAPMLPPLLIDDDGRPITTLAGWETRRKAIESAWRTYLRPLSVEPPPVKLEILAEDRPAGCIRRLVRYECEPGEFVEGYLLLPEKITGRVQGVVALHSTVKFTIRQPAGLEGDEEDFFALKLAQQGIVAFCPRCFLWNGTGSYAEQVAAFQRRHPQSRGMAKMLYDAMRGVDVLVSLPEVDASRIGAVGHSLGGKEGLYLAAFDPRVQVTVSSEGGIGTQFSNWDAPWYLGEDLKAGRFRREHHELLALIAPRSFLLLGGDSADGDRGWPFITAALDVYRLYGEPCRLGFFNHHAGHSVPPKAQQRLYEWFKHEL